jgi:uncharacterized damage-inducible protein DinB
MRMPVDTLFAALNNAFMHPAAASGKPREASEADQAISRSLRDNLETLQRTTDELNQAINDLTAACASTRPANSLAPILRAQSAAASLAASLEVLSRFLAVSLQSVPSLPSSPAMQAAAEASEAQPASARVHAESSAALSHAAPAVLEDGAYEVDAELEEQPSEAHDASEIEEEVTSLSTAEAEPEPPATVFDMAQLRPQEQDLHRRASRVAKVSMQDIKMLRPDDVRLGRQHKDICLRLRDDIEKAHKEYGRRFQSILGHPVDYFYDWMVEILGDGDPAALGEYPYPSPVLRH